MTKVTVMEWGGCVLATRHERDQCRRYWFDETDAGRLVFVSEVVESDDGREYIPTTDMALTDDVTAAIADSRFPSDIVDNRGGSL